MITNLIIESNFNVAMLSPSACVAAGHIAAAHPADGRDQGDAECQWRECKREVVMFEVSKVIQERRVSMCFEELKPI